MDQIKQFVNSHLLRKREEMEWIDEEGDTLLGYVVRRTPRTYRRLARLLITITIPSPMGQPDELLLKQHLSIHRAKALAFPQAKIRQWIYEGWIAQMITLSEDGRTALATNYYMGPALYQYQIQQEHLEMEEREDTLHMLQEKLQTYSLPNPLSPLKKYKQKLVAMDLHRFETDLLMFRWSFIKRVRFLEFFIALLAIRSEKETFDFKEIGAFYYREIGGSKVFDRYRVDFIQLLEAWVGDSIETIGLISQGKIIPIFFSGTIEGGYATYHAGSLHAITDVALLTDQFTTRSKVLWLVENRAMVTRMNASPTFIKETDSLIMCLDGHIRSAHRKFIHQLMQSESIEQVIIWTDYDPSGLVIAEDAYDLLPDSLIVKWISAEGIVYFHLEEYRKWYAEEMRSMKREQEEFLGDERIWKKWIKK